MPELPEVETVVRSLHAAGLPGRRIVAAQVRWPPLVKPLSPRVFARRLCGTCILGVARRAKYIIFQLDPPLTLLVHLRMTGQFNLAQTVTPATPHQHLSLQLDDGRVLHYHDTRKFGRWLLTESPDDVLAPLGPEPLSAAFRWTDLRRRLQASSRRLKPLLLDQTFLAGLGNIYVDEALWLAGLHPCVSAADLTEAQARLLYQSIRRVLRQGIRHGGTTLGEGLGNFNSLNGRGGNREKLRVFQRAGRPCPRCGRGIVRIQVAQRGTHLCPACQAMGRGKELGARD